jgi:simple sugar transport system permease protein
MTGTTGLVAGLLATRLGWNLWPAMLAALVFALVVGYLNGLMVIKTGLPSFIVTLATFFMSARRQRGRDPSGDRPGLRRRHRQGRRVSTRRGSFFNHRASPFLGVRVAQLDHLVGRCSRCIFSWILLRTKYGSWIFATGGDAKSALATWAFPPRGSRSPSVHDHGGASWLVGMMNIVRLRSAVASQGIGQEFVYIIAATDRRLCLLTGGYGSVIGRRHRRPHLRHGAGGHRLRRLGYRLVLQLSRRHAAGRRAGQQLYAASAPQR